MYRLSLLVLLSILIAFSVLAQNPHGKSFRINCAQCHDSKGWQLSSTKKFNHESTGFSLEGQHNKIDCKACHTNLIFSKSKTNCNSCHLDVHNQTVGNDCARCHNSNSWAIQNISTLHDKTSFPLIGVHKTVNCNACHKSSTNLRFNPIGSGCVNCHLPDFQKTKSPNHAKLNLSKECTQCHSMQQPGWKTSIFPDHNAIYPLTGAHAQIANDCQKCHKGSNFTNTPNECIGCHLSNFTNAKIVNHTKVGTGTECASCHTTNPGWTPAKFTIHNQFYPLTGGHKFIENNCKECHTSTNYSIVSKECITCHQNNYQKTINPNHASLKFSTDCASCHSTNPGWNPARFLEHDMVFPLLGAHNKIACSQCHTNKIFKGTPNDCNACHNVSFKSSQNPPHERMGISTDCAACHTSNPGWRPATFTHANYVLTGAHKVIEKNCTQCHNTGLAVNTSKECNSCHQAAFQSTKNPNHVAAGFPTDCASCHTTNPGWSPSTFNHSNFYPLSGAHASTTCAKCHINNTYKNTPTDCISCHTSQYISSQNPNHATLGISKDCASCHTTNPNWRPTTFNHANYYPLQGAHAAIAANCAACHKSGNLSSTPTTCYECHSAQYSSANPNHLSAGFPTTCTNCHNQNTWKPANWNHDAQYFPIYSGKHKGQWTKCTDCHTISNNFSSFSCLNCHKQTSTNNDHRGVQGYSYNSLACFQCHPTGND